MRIAIIGYGKMGKMIEQIALLQGHSIAVIVDPFVTNNASNIQIAKTIAQADFNSVDAAIEFTQPDTALANINALAERKIPSVIGTTGWHDKMDEVVKTIEKTKSALLWASNFSIGVNIFYRIAWHASELFNKFSEYDAGGFEAHHNKKMDSPSGTAKILAEGVLSRLDRKKKIVYETMNRKPQTDEFHFPSLRLGSVPGTHSLFFDSQADTIEITHTARNREGLASGAVHAALWLVTCKRQGVFTIDDVLSDLFKEKI
ncbi:MAG: 4-hydroxy-tetrahydrodipicolinate reductase [Treponema sp.]|nr:4-hydroxy-tetrahydrodipicolinate reductase [Treponema sp.]MCL2251103.1 4-hydroxy-tetrahydrodipicolinate reductase [Treponema sp.]